MNLSTVWVSLCLSWVGLEVLIFLTTRTRSGSGTVRDQGTLRLLWATISLSLTACGFLQAAHLAPMPFAWSGWRLACICLLAFGIVLRATAVLSLGQAFSANVAARTGQQLKRDGLYAIVRHPSYLAMLLIFAAIGLATHDWLCLALATLPTTAALLRRIKVEEELLHQAFGASYANYCLSTRRLLPFLY